MHKTFQVHTTNILGLKQKNKNKNKQTNKQNRNKTKQKTKQYISRLQSPSSTPKFDSLPYH